MSSRPSLRDAGLYEARPWEENWFTDIARRQIRSRSLRRRAWLDEPGVWASASPVRVVRSRSHLAGVADAWTKGKLGLIGLGGCTPTLGFPYPHSR